MDFALASSAHGRRKPCATIFAAALALGGAAPEDAVMVGDNLADDIEGAIASGLRAVLVDRGDRHPDYAGERIGGLAELPPLLGLAAPVAARVRAARQRRRSAASSPSRSSRVVSGFISAQRSQVAPRSRVCTR